MASILLVVTGTAGSPAPNAQDISLRDKLVNLGGHTVTYFESVTSLPASGYDAVVITESGSANSAAITSVPTNGMPVLLLETSWNTVRLATVAATNPATSTQFDITTAGNSHTITSGQADPMTWTSTARGTYGVATTNLASGVTTLAEHATQAGHATLVVAESGATLTTGTAPNRRAASSIGIGSSSVTTWTSACDTLFLDIVTWLVGSTGLGGTLGVTTETDAAQAIGRRKTKSVAGTTETDAAQPITPTKQRTLTPSTETEVAQPFSRRKVRALGTAIESDSPMAFGGARPTIGGTANPATEIDAALPFGRRKVRALGTATEADSAGVAALPTYRFEPPTYRKVITPPPLVYRPKVSVTQGVSVVRINGTFRDVKSPSSDLLKAAGVEGEDYFLGGRIYEVDYDTRLELEAAGYTTSRI